MKQVLLIIAAVFFCFAPLATGFAEMPRGSLAYYPGDTKKILEQKTDYNNAYWILFSLLASSAAYEPENSTEAEYLHRYGWDFTPHRITDGKTVVHFITARSDMADGTPLYVISFRGSAEKKDWAADFMTGQVVYGGKSLEESEQVAGEKVSGKVPPRVHKGFNTYADLSLRMLLDAASHEFLDQYRSEKNARLLLTGHSLGGAVATLVGQRLIDFGFDPGRMQVITFGAPAVANKTFKQMYGDRLNLIRVTNSEDPIPLTFQAVLRNYKQFGKEVRFRIPRTFNNMNHFLHLYLDFGLRNYYDAFDSAVKKGLVKEWPEARIARKDRPVVLLHVKQAEAKPLRETMAILERFMVNEYKVLLPNYIVARSGSDPYEAMRESRADYLLQLDFDAESSRENNNWYLTLEQTLSDKEGNILSVGSTAKRTSPLAGNILAAMEAVAWQKAELLRQMPWLGDAF